MDWRPFIELFVVLFSLLLAELPLFLIYLLSAADKRPVARARRTQQPLAFYVI
jgi:hypothetical protein